MTIEFDGVNNIIKTNTINEVSSGNGVNIDSLIIKDQKITNHAGLVYQTVSAVHDTKTEISSSSTYTDTGLTATITPSASSSKVLVIFGMQLGTNTSGSQNLQARLLRGSTVVRVVDNIHNSSGTPLEAQPFVAFLDSPSTTSSTTYKVQMHGTSSNTFRINNFNTNAGEAMSSMTLLEILQWLLLQILYGH